MIRSSRMETCLADRLGLWPIFDNLALVSLVEFADAPRS